MYFFLLGESTQTHGARNIIILPQYQCDDIFLFFADMLIRFTNFFSFIYISSSKIFNILTNNLRYKTIVQGARKNITTLHYYT